MVWKKVSNSDAGDSTHFGGDDVDKISETFNAGTQTDPINIKDENLYIVDPADTSKKVRFDAGGVTSSSTVVITVPDANITLASTTAASTSVAGLMSAADKTKLDAIEASATADQTNAQIVAAVEAGTDSNTFTDADHSKLNAIEASATADQSNAEIVAAVEAGTDSNTFTDADHSKLNAIEASATADQSNSEIKTAYEANSDTNAFTDANVTTLGNRAPLASPDLTGTATAVNLTMSGNLTVNGTSTTVNTATLSVEDPLIKLASGNNAADTVDVGFYGLYDVGGTDKYAGIVRDASDSGKFIAFKDLQTEPTTTVDKSATGYTKAIIVADIEGDVTGTLTGNASGLSATLAVASGGTGVTSKTGTGNVVLSTSATLVTPALGTPVSGILSGCTVIPMAQASGILPDANMPNLTGAITTVEGAVATTLVANAVDSDNYTDASIDLAHISTAAKTECISMAVSDNTTALAVGTVFTFYMPYAMTLTDIKASVLTAPTGAGLIVDVHDSGTTIMGTDKLDIDVSEFHTSTAGTQPALTDTALANNAKIEVIVDQVGSTVAGAGLVIYLIGYQT